MRNLCDIDPNSMLYWFPKIKKLDIIYPRTEFVPVDFSNNPEIHDEDYSAVRNYSDEVIKKAESFGYPFFLRTDLLSGKHYWNKTCFVKDEESVVLHMSELLYISLNVDMFGREVRAYVVREYIPMATEFNAFSADLPIGVERRYFIYDGKVVCHHPYWIKDAVREGAKLKEPEDIKEILLSEGIDYDSIEGKIRRIELRVPDLPKNWEETLNNLNYESEQEILELTHIAQKVASQFEGFWSVDFCKAKDGRWYFIDMAMGAVSWHPNDCNFFKEFKFKNINKSEFE